MNYEINISKTVQRQISDLPVSMQNRVIEKIKLLTEDARPSGVVKLKGYKNEYRLRVGDYRIRYEIDDKKLVITLLQCKHRREVYKD
jgi:mRNA interferase RelE/StbE